MYLDPTLFSWQPWIKPVMISPQFTLISTGPVRKLSLSGLTEPGYAVRRASDDGGGEDRELTLRWFITSQQFWWKLLLLVRNNFQNFSISSDNQYFKKVEFQFIWQIVIFSSLFWRLKLAVKDPNIWFQQRDCRLTALFMAVNKSNKMWRKLSQKQLEIQM